MGLLISIFLLDDIRSKKRTRPKATVGIKESVRAALRHHKDIRHWLIIPMAVSGAMEMVFIWADFNKVCTSKGAQARLRLRMVR